MSTASWIIGPAARHSEAETDPGGRGLVGVEKLASGSAEALRGGEKVEVGAGVERAVRSGGRSRVVRQTEIPATPVQNPHDPEAQWCTKKTGDGKKEWVGYKTQVAETVPEALLQKDEPTPAFITGMVTQPATGSDEAGLGEILKQQAEMGLDQPAELYVDGAYVSGQALAEAEAEGRQLLGPAQPPARPASRPSNPMPSTSRSSNGARPVRAATPVPSAAGWKKRRPEKSIAASNGAPTAVTVSSGPSVCRTDRNIERWWSANTRHPYKRGGSR